MDTKQPPHFFSQHSETSPADFILVHKPSKEIFMSILHPAASLYSSVTEDKSVSQCYRNLMATLINKGIKVKTVRECLKLNRSALEDLAFQSLTYELSEEGNMNKNEKYQYYLSDEYKRSVVQKLWIGQLVDVVLTRPKYVLKPSDKNTFIEPVSINFKPLGNLLFCRDQQITTRKGVVMGRSTSNQREMEIKIMEQVYKNLNANVIGEAPEGAYIEGGDFFVCRPDLSMLGVGLRTNIKGANYLMKEDLLGTTKFAIVYDETDLDQQRTHLDTYFNILSDNIVMVLDFEDCARKINKEIKRKVYLYSNAKEDNEIDIDEHEKEKGIEVKVGEYKLINKFEDFYSYLTFEGYEMRKVSHQQQKEDMINFLNIGKGTILTVNPELKSLVNDIKGIDVIFVEFAAVQKMYGALHCATQVSRKFKKN